MSIVNMDSCQQVLVVKNSKGGSKFKARTGNSLYTFVVENEELANKVDQSLGSKRVLLK